MLERICVAVGDQVIDADMVPQSSEPELWDTRDVIIFCRVSSWGSILGEGRILWIILNGLLFARLDLLWGRLSGTGDDRVSALIEWLLKL